MFHGPWYEVMIRGAVRVVLATFLVTACTPTTSSSTTTTAVPTTLTDTVPTVDARAYDVLALATHPNGVQLRVDRIEVLPDAIVVSGGVANGSLFGISINRGVTELRLETGEIAPLLGRMDATPIDPSGDRNFVLSFATLSEPDVVTLIFNSGGGSSPVNPASSSPSFELGPIPLDPDETRAPLPDPVPIRRSTVGATGVELQIEGINYTENRIGVWVRISNPLATETRIAPTVAPSQLVDDLGNRYPLVLPEGEGWISIPAGTAQSGVLSFAGRIHPDAATLSLGLNTGARTELTAEDIPLSGETAGLALPDQLVIGAAVDHPTGVRIQIGRAIFTDTGIQVPLVVTNDRDDTVALAATSTLAVDDLGNRYPLVPLPGNPQLIIDANTTIEATFVFSGRVADVATEISMIFNAGRSADDPGTRQPSFRFGPYPLQRTGPAPEPVTAMVFAIGNRSRLVDDVLASSQVDQITQTLTRFDATEVDGGFRLTLPDSILFDFASAELRPDAAQALTLIADVLRFFEGDSVIVIGHTDSIGSAGANHRLSEQRAQSVVEALEDLGIRADRLTSEGRGASEPVAPNTTPDGEDNPEGRQRNRRVEIVVLTDRDLPLP